MPLWSKVTRNKGNVVESVTQPHEVPIPYGVKANG